MRGLWRLAMQRGFHVLAWVILLAVMVVVAYLLDKIQWVK